MGPQIGGDGFFGDSHLDFVCYGDQVVDEGINGYVPCGMKFPTRLDEKCRTGLLLILKELFSFLG